MTLSLSLVNGFEDEITKKIIGFQGHIQVRNLDLNASKEFTPFERLKEFEQWLVEHPEIISVEPTIYKHGIAKSSTSNEGLIFKGLSHLPKSSFFEENLLYGSFPKYSDTLDNYNCVLSKTSANRLSLDTGDRLDVFFIHEGKVRQRKFLISGIYTTGFEERDQNLALCDLRILQRLYSGDFNLVGTYEIAIRDEANIEKVCQEVDDQLDHSKTAISIVESNAMLFQWLKIVHSNIFLILGLVLLVSTINMATTSLILILDRTMFIGILKTLGLGNYSLNTLFLRHGLALTSMGFGIGSLISLIVILIQKHYKLIPLDSKIYYMSYVPVKLDGFYFLEIFILLIASSFLSLILPARLISRIHPSKALRFS